MPVGILDGKRILVAGVTLDSSIGFATAKVAQEQGATVLISNFGRALSITRRIAKRLPVEPPVLELDVTDADHLAGLPDAVREHVDGLEVDCRYTAAERGCPTRFELVMKMPAHLSEEQVERLQVIAAKCPVHRTLEGEVAFDERVELTT